MPANQALKDHAGRFKKTSRSVIALPTYGSRTDIGCIRDHNEDSLIASPPIFAVADGMGGHAAGEVASEVAVTTLLEHAPQDANVMTLGAAVEQANRAVILAADERQGLRGMGTTMTAAVVDQDRVAIAHVGDSRAYLLHQGKLQQITRDHSLMADLIESGQLTEEEARVHPKRSVITRALGSDARMTPDLYEINVEAGDRLLLCSDGLSSMVSEEYIETLLARTRDPQKCANNLVDAALAAGGHDNVTVVVVDISHLSEKKRKRIMLKSRAFMIGIALAILACFSLAIFGMYYYVEHSAFLKAENGYVVIYRGLPDELFGQHIAYKEEVTNVPVDKLQPGVAMRLSNGGVRVDSVDAAKKLVDEYRASIQQQFDDKARTQSAQEAKRIASGEGLPTKTNEERS